jgi:sugar/nucleoside kinase (ribokinase family)
MAPTGVFVGAATLDLHYLLPRFPTPNSKGPAQGFGMYAGGPATNAAVTFAHLGGSARLFTEIGCHPVGRIVAADIVAHGVELVDMTPDIEAPPMLSSIITTADSGDRTGISSRYPNVGAHPGNRRFIVHGDAVLLLDGFLAASGRQAARQAKGRGVPIVLDAGSWKPQTEDLLPLTDVAICSGDFHPPATATPEEALDVVLASGVERAAVTRGGEPILYRAASSIGEIPVEAVPVVDTLGAGDIFHGAFCFALASGAEFTEALAEAAAVATASTQHFGTRAWMRGETGD